MSILGIKINPNFWKTYQDIMRDCPGVSKGAARGLLVARQSLPTNQFTCLPQFRTVARSVKGIGPGVLRDIMRCIDLPAAEAIFNRVIGVRTHHNDELGFIP